jgi:hypothetical protein
MDAAEIRVEEESCLLSDKKKCIAHLRITAEVRISAVVAVDVSDIRNRSLS